MAILSCMKPDTTCGRPHPPARATRRGTLAVLVGIAAGFALLFGLGAAVGVVDPDTAVYAGCALAAAGGVIAFLGES